MSLVTGVPELFTSLWTACEVFPIYKGVLLRMVMIAA